MFHLFHQRDDDVSEAASNAGLESSQGDPLGCDRAPFPLFRRGQIQQVERVLWRDADPHQVRVFDFRYQRNLGNQSEVSPIFTCATAVVNAAWPPLLITPSPLRDEREALEIGGDRIQLESEAFNEAFRVHSPDARFASAFLDAQMQQFLLDTGRALTFELRGAWLLAFTEHIPANLLPHLFPFVDDLLEHVPDVVTSLYPPALPGGIATPAPPLVAPAPAVAVADGDIAPTALDSAVRFEDEVLGSTSRYGSLRTGGFGMFGASVAGSAATDIAMRAEIIEDPAWNEMDHGALGALDGPDEGADFDLDGHPIAPHQQDPWGAGRPEGNRPDPDGTE